MTATAVETPDLASIVDELIGTPYVRYDCWDLLRHLFARGWDIDLDTDPFAAIHQAQEIWYQGDARDPLALMEPWDICIYQRNGLSSGHVGVVFDTLSFVHTRRAQGVCLEPLRRWKSHLLQVARLRCLLPPLVIPEPPLAPSETPTGMLSAVLLLSPLRAPDGRWRTHREVFPAGDPLDCYLPEREDLSRVTVNGAAIDPAAYATYVPKPGDELWLFPRWGYVPGVTEALLVGLAVSLISMTASHFLFKPKPVLLPPQNTMTEATEERTFSFEGIRTAQGPGAVVPVVYGRHRIGGQLLRFHIVQAQTIVDSGVPAATVPIQHIEAGFGVWAVVTAAGHGLVSYQSVQIEGVISPFGVNTVWIVEVLTPDHFYLQYSESITENRDIPYEGAGYFRRYQTGIATTQAVTAPPAFNLLLALCEGPISEVLVGTIQINGQPIGNFPGVEVFVRLGTGDQTPIAELGEIGNTFSDGRDIPADILTVTTQGPVHAFVLNIVFNQGLFKLSETGHKETNWVTLQYRFAVTETGAWSQWVPFTIAADRTAPVRMGVRRHALAFQVYDIQIQFLTAATQDDVRAKWQPTLESITELVAGTEAFPFTALMGLRGLATDQLQGQLPNVTVEIKGRTVRVGTLAPVETWSDNPAWCILDLLTHPRFGRGEPDGSIDLAAWAVYAAYCDQVLFGERRHTLNYVLDREIRAQTAFLETMGGSRGLLLKTAGLWSPRPTRNETPTALLSWTNSTNVRLTYLRDMDGVNVLEARYLNEEDDFDTDVLSWPPVESWPAIVEKQSLDLRGVTKPSRIMRALQYELNRRRFENLVLEMDCSAEAVTVQMHDLFRFSHPLPGWGISGRVLDGSTSTTLFLDESVGMGAGVTYVVYVRHANDVIDTREVSPVLLGQVQTLHLASALSQMPVPRMTTWTFGTLVQEGNTRVFRVTALQRRSDTTVHLEAIIHNPTIYDEPVGTLLPPVSLLFNPFGPPPPLLMLIATEVTRVQPSGASFRAVNLSWDVAGLSGAYAPYGGAHILRRAVMTSSHAGQAAAGTQALGVVNGVADANTNFVPLGQVRGHVLDFDDATVIQGTTYVYRVIPVSNREIPNQPGAREVMISVTGPTTPGYFPATPQQLRLRGQLPTVTTFEGRDIHLEWDPVPQSPLFTATFFVQDYVLQIWAPGQLYLLRQTVVPIVPAGQSIQYSYGYEQHTEDQLRAGQRGARRDLLFLVFARTNTGLQSLEPAQLAVNNPPPDMGDMAPEVTPLFQAAIIEWRQFVEPRDFSHYDVYLDTVNPPQALYQQAGAIFQKVLVGNLTPDVLYYARIVPSDTFGTGIPSVVTSFTVFSLDPDAIDTMPPGQPTGLSLTTGNTINPDGTVAAWVQASWTPNAESDLGGYQVHFRIEASLVPIVFSPGAGQNTVRWEGVPGAVTVYARLLAFDRVRNMSTFTPEVSIVTSADTVPPGPPVTAIANGTFKAVALLWQPPADDDYLFAEVWASQTANRATAVAVGEGYASYVHGGLLSNATWYYWFRSRDRSGNASAFVPGDLTPYVATTIPTVEGDIGNLSITETKIANDSISTPKLQANSVDANKVTTGELITLGAQIRAAIINNAHIISLTAGKITAGTITALVGVGAGTSIFLDGVNNHIIVRDNQPATRVQMGNLGPGATDYGIRIFSAAGAVMFDATAGGVTANGITTGVINSGHLRADTAVITVAAQIANALITDAHITNLSADKIATGTLQAFYSIGVGAPLFNMYLDGTNRQLVIRDDNLVNRVVLGKLGAGGTEYGLTIANGAGQVMWNFTTGATTAGISDASITTAKIGVAQILEAHIFDAQITNAKMHSVVADKITTGTLVVPMNVGSGQVVIDGTNNLLYINDATPARRVNLGKLGAGGSDYGLEIFTPSGQLMWHFSSGATTPGIFPNAVSASLVFTSSGGGLTNNTELSFASLTFPTIAAGDSILILGTGTLIGDGTSGVAVMHLRSGSLAGPELHRAQISAGIDGSLMVMHAFVASSASSGATFVLSVTRTGAGAPGSVSQVRMSGLRLQR